MNGCRQRPRVQVAMASWGDVDVVTTTVEVQWSISVALRAIGLAKNVSLGKG